MQMLSYLNCTHSVKERKSGKNIHAYSSIKLMRCYKPYLNKNKRNNA